MINTLYLNVHDLLRFWDCDRAVDGASNSSLPEPGFQLILIKEDHPRAGSTIPRDVLPLVQAGSRHPEKLCGFREGKQSHGLSLLLIPAWFPVIFPLQRISQKF